MEAKSHLSMQKNILQEKITANSNFFDVYNQADIISTEKYHKTISLLRNFFLSEGFLEVAAQSRRSILAACEDPKTVHTYTMFGEIWPLPQTGQMWLEYELLTKPDVPGYFCITSSYRGEENPIPGRHHTLFPMFEFEMHGGMDALIDLEKRLISYLSIARDSDIKQGKYLDMAKKYNTEIIENEHENEIWNDYGPAFLLTHFPKYTSPFWNMKMDGDIAKKLDVILCGYETIGSAERATDVGEMYKMFQTISDGEYADLLYRKFGRERVNRELDDYFNLKFFERSGAGVGVSRMIRALELCNII